MNGITQVIANQVDESHDYNLFTTDAALQALTACTGQAGAAVLAGQGAILGQTAQYALAEQANRHTPLLHRYDARGRPIDRVEFHPAWHHWLTLARRHGLHALPYQTEAAPDAWVQWAAGFYMHAQIEAGSLCPAAMTLGSVPLLRDEPGLWQTLGRRLLANDHDADDLPIDQKRAAWIGMGMTEKSGGSDLRGTTTTACPEAGEGRGRAYRLEGHKWFYSAPMCDAHLVLARTPDDRLACFFVPRRLPDGGRNGVHLLRLKDKVGNASNASAEVEFHDAWGVMVGEPGRGVATLIEMAAITRLTCALASAGMMRQALVQALAYTRQRRAFGRALADQPLMRAVLADLALESEAATTLAMYLAQASQSHDEIATTWRRIMTPAAKFVLCKRAVAFTAEAMEACGGNGYVAPSILGRLYREAPVNALWEGSGNVMCLDVLRALARAPESLDTLLTGLQALAHDDRTLSAELQALRTLGRQPTERLEAIARQFTHRLVTVAQGCLLRSQAPQAVADAFISTRYGSHWGALMGTVYPDSTSVTALLARALP